MIRIKKIAVVSFVALFCVFGAVSAKEAAKVSIGGKNARNSWDEKHGINYEEDRVGSCVLPDPLVNPHNGFRASNAVEWIEKIRPAVVEEVEKLYGPALPRPLQMRFEVEESGEAFSGKAIRKQIRIYLKGDTGKEFSFGVLMYAPKAKGPLPAFVNMNFYGNHTVADDPSIIVGKYWIKDGTINGYKVRGHSPSDVVRGIHATSHPIGAILDAGFAYLTFCYCEAFPDTGEAAINSKNISAIFSDSVYPHKRAAISVWSWAISRVMDYIESQPLLDKTRIAVVGHSRQGKTALLTGALDTRFAMVISNGSGCMGAKLSRRNYGENISSITDRFGYWFSDNLKKYAFAEGKMPIDQHQLLALIAPRPVYVESASEDRWADPKGQISALVAANPVYGLFGAKDLPTMANENVPFCGATGYHLRKGKHALTEEDWEYFIKFARKHFCDKRSDGNRHSNRKVGSSHPLQPCGSFSVKPGKCTQPLSNVLRCVLNKNGKRIWRASFLPKSTIPLHCSAYGNKMIFSWRCKPGIITMILDSNDYEIVDIILHFGLPEDDPVMQSPSGRYLLFKKFSPRMSPPPVASDFIMVYDLKKNA